jgi:hypothetical protein
MATAATCICLQQACESGVVDEAQLLQLAQAAGLKVRKVSSATADLLVSKAGSTLAFLLWRRSGDGDSMSVRAARLAGSFKRSYVLVPNDLQSNSEVLTAASRCAIQLCLLPGTAKR